MVGDKVDTGLHAGMGPFPEHILLQLVDIWGAMGVGVRDYGPAPSSQHPSLLSYSPSNLPEKLSVARHRFFFRPLFLASGMSMGWLAGMSARRATGSGGLLPGLAHISTGPYTYPLAQGP